MFLPLPKKVYETNKEHGLRLAHFGYFVKIKIKNSPVWTVFSNLF